MSAKLTPQQAVLFNQVRDCLALSTVPPASQHTQHDLQCGGVDHEAQLISRADLKNVGRIVEHYGHGLNDLDRIKTSHAETNFGLLSD